LPPFRFRCLLASFSVIFFFVISFYLFCAPCEVLRRLLPYFFYGLCPFGGQDSHPTTLLLLPGSALEDGPSDLTARLLPIHHAHLPQTFRKKVVQSIGSNL